VHKYHFSEALGMWVDADGNTRAIGEQSGGRLARQSSAIAPLIAAVDGDGGGDGGLRGHTNFFGGH
jgi:hypothetical protein